MLPLLLLFDVVLVEEGAEEEVRRVRFRRPPPLREAMARALERRPWRWGRGSCCWTDAERRFAVADRRPGCRRKDKRVMVRLFRPASHCCRGLMGKEDEKREEGTTRKTTCPHACVRGTSTFEDKQATWPILRYPH